MDQFRGYAILGMIAVNFISRFDVTPWMLRHHRVGMSYNDTIAPLFIFVVGMGFRLSFLRRSERDGPWATRRAAAKRYGFLTLLGLAIYWGYFWDALSDIGLAGLLALPLMHTAPWVRVVAGAACLGAYQAIFSLTGYGEHVMTASFNGGPFGPLSWVFILLLGTVAYDLVAGGGSRRIAAGCLGWGIGLSVAGWVLRAPWPGVKPAWPFSQYGMSAPYPLYATGLCFLALLGFHWFCDVRGFQFPHLAVLGRNPLVMYLAHGVAIGIGLLLFPNDARWFVVLLGFALVYGLCYALALWMDRKGVIVKI